MNTHLLLAVGMGGAVGSVARYLIGIGSSKLLGSTFPWGTLIINIVGSLLIGALVEWFAIKSTVSQTTRVFLTVGHCGGFTTFSTFSLDAYHLLERGEFLLGLVYVLSSVVLSVGALVLAIYLVRAAS